RRRGDGALALELEQVGDDAVGDRARDLVLAKARSEKRAVGAIRGEPGLDENGRSPSRGEHRETRLLHAAIAAGMDPGRGVLDQLGELRRLPQILVHRSEEHTSELQSLPTISYAVFCL